MVQIIIQVSLDVFQFPKINDKPVVVELLAGKGDIDIPVVTVYAGARSKKGVVS